jgi:hypothetical protein
MLVEDQTTTIELIEMYLGALHRYLLTYTPERKSPKAILKIRSWEPNQWALSGRSFSA